MAVKKSTGSKKLSPGAKAPKAIERTVKKRDQRLFHLMDQLPFRGEGPKRNGRSCSWWNVPAKGEYSGGNDVGAAAAYAFMKFLREDGRTDTGGSLQLIALDMLLRRKDSSSLRGQAVGFFSVLDYYLRKVALVDSGLDSVAFESCKNQIEKGLSHTKADDEAKLRSYRREAAKLGWETRREAKSQPM